MTHSAISLGVGLGGGRSATSSGRLPSGGGGAFANTLSGSFDGTDDYLSVTDVPALDTASALTFSFWGKPAASGKSLGMESLISSTDKIILYLWYTNVVYFGVRNGGSPSAASQAFTADGNWHHICGTYDGSTGTIKLYIDGSLVSTQTGAPSTTSDLSGNFVVGKSGGSDYNEGLIDEVAIFNSALSASDVTAIYNSGVPADLTSLSPVTWYRLGDGTGDTDSGGGTPASGDTIGTVVDQGSGSNNATNPNGAIYSSTVPS
tara:strand:+ start:376 stop:1161 length:786 start_codon:yes stop_codon:yes gene_type:complete